MYDGIGQIVALVDENGKIVVSWKYDAWGVPTEYDADGNQVPVGTFKNPYLYKSYYYDVETGLYYLNARYYDPAIGRFLSRDPAPGNQKDRLDLNSYLYCKNNPLIHADPSGLYWRLRSKSGREYHFSFQMSKQGQKGMIARYRADNRAYDRRHRKSKKTRRNSSPSESYIRKVARSIPFIGNIAENIAINLYRKYVPKPVRQEIDRNWSKVSKHWKSGVQKAADIIKKAGSRPVGSKIINMAISTVVKPTLNIVSRNPSVARVVQNQIIRPVAQAATWTTQRIFGSKQVDLTGAYSSIDGSRIYIPGPWEKCNNWIPHIPIGGFVCIGGYNHAYIPQTKIKVTGGAEMTVDQKMYFFHTNRTVNVYELKDEEIGKRIRSYRESDLFKYYDRETGQFLGKIETIDDTGMRPSTNLPIPTEWYLND